MNYFSAQSPCQQEPCGDHGDCDVTVYYNYTCICRGKYTGDTCSEPPNLCENEICLNEGKCVSQTNDFFCSCPVGYTGTHCETHIGESKIQD